jgi:putative ABC transport system ATP-binding protein
MTAPVVTASRVSRRYRTAAGTITAVRDFDLTMEPGQLVALHGPSSSGKTAVVHLLAGWEQPDQGTISWAPSFGSPPSWSDLAVIPQTLALLDELTVAENINLPVRAAGRRARPDSELAAAVEELGLLPLMGRPVDKISVGEQQRVMVARALASRPAVILADEPTAHQDDRNADIIASLLVRAAGRGAACLVATRQSCLRALADHAEVRHRQVFRR